MKRSKVRRHFPDSDKLNVLTIEPKSHVELLTIEEFLERNKISKEDRTKELIIDGQVASRENALIQADYAEKIELNDRSIIITSPEAIRREKAKQSQ